MIGCIAGVQVPEEEEEPQEEEEEEEGALAKEVDMPISACPSCGGPPVSEGSMAEKAAAAQGKINDFMKGKVLNFYGGSWDLKAYSTNSSILVGLATILKENPELVLNIHGKQVGSCRARITKDPRTGKTFAACFPGIENTLQPDALARARALNTLNALKEMGCHNRMTTSSQVSAVKQIVFQVRGIKAANTEGKEPSCSCCGRPVEAKVRAWRAC